MLSPYITYSFFTKYCESNRRDINSLTLRRNSETWKAYRSWWVQLVLNLQLHTSSFYLLYFISVICLKHLNWGNFVYHFNFLSLCEATERKKVKTIITYHQFSSMITYWWVRIQGQSRKGWFSFSTALPQITQQLSFFLFYIQVLRGKELQETK